MKGFTSKPPMRIDDSVARELSAFLVVISKSNNVDEPIVIESDSDEQNKKGHNTSPDGPIVFETDSEDEINHGHDTSMGKPTVIEIDSNKEKGKARYTKLEEPELETESFNPHGNKSLFRAAIPRSAESNLMFGGSKIEQDQGIRDSISTDELDGGTPCVAFPKKSDRNSHKITSVSTAKETTIATGVKKCHARKEREVPNNYSIGLRRPLRSARRTENSSVSLNGRKKSCDKTKAGGTNTTLSTLVKHLSEDEVEDQENEDIGSKYDEKEEHKNNNDDTDNHSDVSAEAMRSHRVRSLRTRNALITKDQKKVTDLELHCENMVEEFFKAYNPKTLEIGALKKRIEKRKKRMMKFQEDMSDFEIRKALGETE
ncbi:hypothetical protein B0J11DRAFT_539458 [Dendryphion nanum]|uniref:Uncharacterized protein n=1 Tax=Dendryphion nanum TaxID=256645 RepID=A0A9P9DBB4_9PLEO|nr:hypothetical protein B0J11DRAFT_539458 [Dendryphion nanum]